MNKGKVPIRVEHEILKENEEGLRQAFERLGAEPEKLKLLHDNAKPEKSAVPGYIYARWLGELSEMECFAFLDIINGVATPEDGKTHSSTDGATIIDRISGKTLHIPIVPRSERSDTSEFYSKLDHKVFSGVSKRKRSEILSDIKGNFVQKLSQENKKAIAKLFASLSDKESSVLLASLSPFSGAFAADCLSHTRLARILSVCSEYRCFEMLDSFSASKRKSVIKLLDGERSRMMKSAFSGDLGIRIDTRSYTIQEIAWLLSELSVFEAALCLKKYGGGWHKEIIDEVEKLNSERAAELHETLGRFDNAIKIRGGYTWSPISATYRIREKCDGVDFPI